MLVHHTAKFPSSAKANGYSPQEAQRAEWISPQADGEHHVTPNHELQPSTPKLRTPNRERRTPDSPHEHS